MKEATLIYPHQLFTEHPALDKDKQVYLVEEPLLLTEFPTHRQKLLLHRLSMQAYKHKLKQAGYNVIYIELTDVGTTTDVFSRIKKDRVTHVHIVDTTDFLLEKRIKRLTDSNGLNLTQYESPLFILTKDEAADRYTKSKQHLAQFYKQLRKDKNILMEDGGNPVGGKWSFDEDNRKKLPKNISLPDDISYYVNSETAEALDWLHQISGEFYGEENVFLPYTRDGAQKYMQDFFAERFAQFGTYEDAITSSHIRIFHSTLSPLINIGLLSPQEVIDAALVYADQHDIALNNTEGFVRQILGWREFIRAAYECDGVEMRTKNFWNHTRALPDSFWDATTGIPPIDDAIRHSLDSGYSHHIERLMVLGNFMLLNNINPDEVYRWFMAMYVDAYDWVMVPNVYGMSQFADGGTFATKPYISGSNYIKKMSDYPAGDWEQIWTALYWNFINTHKEFFLSNHRLSMMPRLLEKMDSAKKADYMSKAKEWLS